MTLLEAATKASAWLDRWGYVMEEDNAADSLRTALRHEADERRDIERLLVLLGRDTWISGDGHEGREEELATLVEQVEWRRKAVADQEKTK